MFTLEILRQYRVGPFPVFDTVISYLGILIISPLLSKFFSLFHLNIPISSWLWLTLPISVVFHLIFHQDTPLVRILSDPNQLQFYIALIVLLLMVFMGLKNIGCQK